MTRKGYPLKAGHHTPSTTSRHALRALPRSGQVLDMRYHRFTELRACPPEKSRGRRCAIRRATIDVLQDRPPLGTLCGQAPLIVMQLRARAVTACNGRGGTLQGFAPVGCPCLPRCKALRGKPRRDGVRLKGRTHCGHCLLALRFPSAAPGARALGSPRAPGEEARVPPLLPSGREEEGLPVRMDSWPPKVHEGCQGRPWLADLAYGVVRTLRAPPPAP